MMAVGAILFGSNQFTPQLLQTNFPYTAMLSGFAVMPGRPRHADHDADRRPGRPGSMQPKYWMAIGLATIALAMWYSTSLTPDASFGYFVTMRMFQTVGLPFLFIPINSVVL